MKGQVVVIGKNEDAAVVWKNQRKTFQSREFTAMVRVEDSSALKKFISTSLLNRFKENGSPDSYEVMLQRVDDVQELVRAAKRGFINHEVIFFLP